LTGESELAQPGCVNHRAEHSGGFPKWDGRAGFALNAEDVVAVLGRKGQAVRQQFSADATPPHVIADFENT
jgi:hypothetical protein